MAIAEDIGLDDDLSPQTRLIGKRPPSISGETASITTRLRPSNSTSFMLLQGDDMVGAIGCPNNVIDPAGPCQIGELTSRATGKRRNTSWTKSPRSLVFSEYHEFFASEDIVPPTRGPSGR